MTIEEKKALDRLGTQTSVDDVQKVMRNARNTSIVVYRAAFKRLVELSTLGASDPVARACWKMVHTIEQIRRENRRKVWRMNRLRPKIEREGAKAALAYCAMSETDGFTEVLEYGLPEYTAEAIILGYPAEFSDPELQKSAMKRLKEAGIEPSQFIGKPLV